MATSNHTGPLQPPKGRFIENFGLELSPPVSSICGWKDGGIGPESPPSLVVFYDGRDPSLTPADLRGDGVLHSPTLTLISERAITPLRLPSPCSPVAGEPAEWLLSRRYVSQGPFSAPTERIVPQVCRDSENAPSAEGEGEEEKPGSGLPSEDSDSDWFTVGDDEATSECLSDEGHDLGYFAPNHNYPASTTHMTSSHSAVSRDENRLSATAAALRCRLQDTPSLGSSSIPRRFRSRRRADSYKEDQISEEGSDLEDFAIGSKLYRV